MLAGNRLARLPASLEGHRSLELLRLSANRFEALPAFLAALPRLAWLGFGGNPAEGARTRAQAGPVVPRAALALGAALGEGASGRVHAARWDGRDVAFKEFKSAVTSDGLPAHEMAAALAVGAHPQLLGALAAVEAGAEGRPGLLLPLIPPGWRTLAGPPSLVSCTRDVYDPALRLAGSVATRIAGDIATAGAHLAASGVLHGDLYAHNIHWDGGPGAAVLGDFGAASLGRTGDRLETLDVLAWGILARELLERADPCEATVTLGHLADAACAPDPAARPRFAELLGAGMQRR